MDNIITRRLEFPRPDLAPQDSAQTPEIASVIADASLVITGCASTATSGLGDLAGELGHPLGDLGERIGYSQLTADAASVLETGAPIAREVLGAGGKSFLVRLLPYRTLDDQRAGVALTFTELGQPERARELSRQNEALFSALIEQAPMGVYAVDADFRLFQVNTKAQPVFRHVRPLLGRDFPEILHLIWPAPAAEAILEHFRVTLETGIPYPPTNFTERREDTGVEETYEWQLLRVTLPTGGNGVVCYFNDVTERWRAERILHQHVASMKASLDGMAILDADQTLIFVNEAFAKIHGYETPSPLVGRRWNILYDETEHARMQTHIDAALQPDGYWRGELIGRRRDGSRLPQEVSLSRIESGGIVCVVRDITEHKNHAEQLEKQVAERTRLLQESVRSLETLSYTMAHDLRAPIRSMLGFSKALQEDVPLDQTGKFYAERIVKASLRMDQLIGDLLEYSKVTHHEFPLRDFSLKAKIEKVVRDVAYEARNHIRILEPMPRIRGNDTLTEQILSNLLLNALKFVAPGVTPEVVLRAETRGANARLWVEDNGIGIAPEHQALVFGVFQRLHTARAYPGTGVGLAIVARCAERMGGSVGLESEAGHGSRFWVELPLASELVTETSEN